MADPEQFRTSGALAMLTGTDREMAERHLLQAEQAFVAGASQIDRQEKIIREMEAKGQDVTLAKELLKTFLVVQQEHAAHRDRLKVELGLDPGSPP